MNLGVFLSSFNIDKGIKRIVSKVKPKTVFPNKLREKSERKQTVKYKNVHIDIY